MVIKAYCARAAAPFSVKGGLRTADCGLRTVDYGLLTGCNIYILAVSRA